MLCLVLRWRLDQEGGSLDVDYTITSLLIPFLMGNKHDTGQALVIEAVCQQDGLSVLSCNFLSSLQVNAKPILLNNSTTSSDEL